MRPSTRVLAAVAASALLAAGCSRAATSTSTPASTGTSTASPAQSAAETSAAGDFGTLKNVCHGGSATGQTDQGVTSSSIKAGVLTDVGFTKDPQLENAAKAFTSWCNAAGGIDGRKLVTDIHDTQLLQVVPAMTSACGSDFVLAGGSAALDGLSVATRLKCLLPDFDEQPTMAQNAGSALQVAPVTFNYTYSGYTGYYDWLLSKYPGSAKHVAVVTAQSVITEVDTKMVSATIQADGGSAATVISFPETGVANWTPYAESIKSKGIKGFVFYGTPQELAALEQALDNIGYQPDWIDTNTDNYTAGFIQIDGKALTQQHNYAPLNGVYPVEKAAANPAVEQIVSLLKQYAPGQPVSLQVLQAFSAWLIFAVSAESCGADLTRSCVYQAALKQTAWTGGGITAPVDMATPLAAPDCFDIEQATPAGWEAAPFDPNNGVYRCGEPALKLGSGYPAPLQLSTVGKTLADLK
ncbi:MAG TPA: ABC transporter substrate-binding protein [Trebonia sp.]|jgi:ABC-type branched-subunit amino acid transport system substrate-binding protein